MTNQAEPIPPSSFLIRLLETREELDRLAPEWNRLVYSSEANSIFVTWEWVSAWMDAVYPKVHPMTVAVYLHDQLVGLAPFYLSSFRLFNIYRYSCLRFLGDCHSGAEYPDIIVQKGVEKPVLQAIASCLDANKDKWDCAYFPSIAGWTGAVERLNSVFSSLSFFLRQRPAIFSIFALPGSHEEFQLRHLSSIIRKSLRNYERSVKGHHADQIDYCNESESLKEFLEDLFVLHRKRWESVGQLGSFIRRPRMQIFYKTFAPIALRNNWLQLSRLKLAGKPIAVQFGYLYNNSYLQLQEGFDPDGPTGSGNALRYRVIQRCIEQNIQEYDFLGDFTPHKKNWGAKERNGIHLFMGNKKLKNCLLKFVQIWPSGRYIKEGAPVT